MRYFGPGPPRPRVSAKPLYGLARTSADVGASGRSIEGTDVELILEMIEALSDEQRHIGRPDQKSSTQSFSEYAGWALGNVRDVPESGSIRRAKEGASLGTTLSACREQLRDFLDAVQ